MDGSPTLVNGDGDGTVNIRSLQGCQHWKKIQKRNVYDKGFAGVDHMGILSDKRMLDYISQLIVNQI